MECKKGFEVKTLYSKVDKAWYMGVSKDDSNKIYDCRLTEFAESRERAMQLPWYRQFACADNEYCNGGSGCFK